MIEFRIEYVRYSSRDGSRGRTDFIRASSLEEALSIANQIARAWGEVDRHHTYRVNTITYHNSVISEEAAIGWATSEEWRADNPTSEA